MSTPAKLIFMCGKMAAGKSTLARDLAQRDNAILLVQDEFFGKLVSWFRRIFERANVEHELHFVDASDALCKRQLKDRSKTLPPGAPWTTDAEFEAITMYFQPPSDDEGFNVVRHERA